MLSSDKVFAPEIPEFTNQGENVGVIMPRCACVSEVYGSVCVCVCVCV